MTMNQWIVALGMLSIIGHVFSTFQQGRRAFNAGQFSRGVRLSLESNAYFLCATLCLMYLTTEFRWLHFGVTTFRELGIGTLVLGVSAEVVKRRERKGLQGGKGCADVAPVKPVTVP